MLQKLKSFLRNNFNGKFLFLLCIIIVTMMAMHYYMAFTVDFESRPGLCNAVSNLLSCVIDVTVIYLLAYAVTWGRVKTALIISYWVTAILAFCNIVYARFFGLYLPKKVLAQVTNLNDQDVALSILSGLSRMDLVYFAVILVVGCLFLRWSNECLKRKSFPTLGAVFSVALAGHFAAMFLLLASGREHTWKKAREIMVATREQSIWEPNTYLFRNGFTRRFLYCFDDYRSHSFQLEPDQVAAIDTLRADQTLRRTDGPALTGKNLVFILVESYLAASSDLVVDGQEVTPFLNRLKREGDCYYNGHLQPDITCGESSDGQLIYMTGVLPLQADITVSIAKDLDLQGLPEILHRDGWVADSHVIVPTSATFWSQDRMSDVYGFRTLYAKSDIKGKTSGENLTDEEIFSFAASVDTVVARPFFSLILTMSMHEPYNHAMQHGFALTDGSLPENYRNYLIDCHYFDAQLERYIQSLKDAGIYDDSILIIVSDHDAHPAMLDMENRISTDLPLYIINGDIDPSSAWTGSCHQLDVYTTILDLIGAGPDWLGLGHTLLTDDYTDSVTEEARTASEWIIRGNYFGSR